MAPEYWMILGLALAVAEVLAPGTFLIFLATGALMTALVSIVFASLSAQLAAFAVASIASIFFGNSLYRRILYVRGTKIGRGPIGEQGIVEERLVNGRGKVRVRDISWLATGPDLAEGTPIVVKGRHQGTLLEVAALHKELP